jgi:hypothetical protein
MYLDSDRQASIEVHACSMCGNRIYSGYRRRRGERAQARWEAENFMQYTHNDAWADGEPSEKGARGTTEMRGGSLGAVARVAGGSR